MTNLEVTTKKKSAKREVTERVILDATIKLFTANGYERTSSKQIAAESGCSEGLIFKYFINKSNLYAVIFQEWSDSRYKELIDLPPSEDFRSELVILIGYFLDNYSSNLDVVTFHLGQKFHADFGADVMKIREDFIQKRFLVISNRLVKYQKNQKINVGLIIDIMNGYFLMNIVFNNWHPDEYSEKISQLVDILLHGIKSAT